MTPVQQTPQIFTLVLVLCLLASFVVFVVAVVLFVASAVSGSARNVPDDGSTYSWPGAGRISADVSPGGSGFVRSTPQHDEDAIE
jgi:hypothetical protein